MLRSIAAVIRSWLTGAMLDGVDDIAWDQFPGPEQYEPDSVVPSLHRLAAAQTFDEAEAAYTNVLFAVGNNHAGTLYPASQAALPFVLAIGLEGNGWAKWGALQTLTRGKTRPQARDQHEPTKPEVARPPKIGSESPWVSWRPFCLVSLLPSFG